MSEINEFDPLDPDMLNDEYWETLYWEEELDFVVFINEKERKFDIQLNSKL